MSTHAVVVWHPVSATAEVDVGLYLMSHLTPNRRCTSDIIVTSTLIFGGGFGLFRSNCPLSLFHSMCGMHCAGIPLRLKAFAAGPCENPLL